MCILCIGIIFLSACGPKEQPVKKEKVTNPNKNNTEKVEGVAKKRGKTAQKVTNDKQKGQKRQKADSNKNKRKINPSGDTTGGIGVINGKRVNPKSNKPIEIKEDVITLKGWAINGKNNNATELPAKVFVVVDGEKEFPTKYGEERSKIAESMGGDYLKSGFSAKIPVDKIGKGKHSLTLKNVSKNNESKINTDRKVEIIIK